MTIRDSIYRSVMSALREHTLADLLDAMGEPLDVAPRPGLAPKRKARPRRGHVVVDGTATDLGALVERVREMVADAPVRTETIREALGASASDIARALAALRVEGAIVTSGRGRGTTHTLATPAAAPAAEVVQ